MLKSRELEPMSHSIILYGKPDCHLCENVRQLLRELRREADFVVEEIDITRDPALFKKYFDKIPVVLIDKRTTLYEPIRIEQVRAAFRPSR